MLDEACMKYRSSSSSGFQCVTISNNIFQWLFIGSDGPPKPQKNEKVPLSISICVLNFFVMKLNAKCKEPQMCCVKRRSATPFMNWSTSTQNSSFAQGSRLGGRCLSGNRCSGPGDYLRQSLTFCPRVQCWVAWYDALPAHLPSAIKRVQMRALTITYLRKLYNLLESIQLRTSAVGSVWAL